MDLLKWLALIVQVLNFILELLKQVPRAVPQEGGSPVETRALQATLTAQAEIIRARDTLERLHQDLSPGA